LQTATVQTDINKKTALQK